MPATNATRERSFSAMRRLKSYLRSRMHEARLNHLMVLHVHKSKTDSLNLIRVANNFVASAARRQTVLGTFSELDVSRTHVLQKSRATQTSAVKVDSGDAKLL